MYSATMSLKILSPITNLSKLIICLFIGSLNVYLGHTTSGTYVEEMKWSLTGDQEIMWIEATVPLTNLTAPYQVLFEAISSVDGHGNIAIDDVEFLQFDCTIQPPEAALNDQPSASTTAAPIPDGPVNCDFDNDFCQYTQVSLQIKI